MCAAKLSDNFDVALLDKNSRVGKKLLASGNGRCNIFNSQTETAFYSNDFVQTLLKKYPTERLIEEFKGLGVPLCFDENCAYPQSYQSSCVVNALLQATQKATVKVDFDACSIEKCGNGFKVLSADGKEVIGKAVVLACGSNASFGYASLKLGENFNIKHKSFIPALCPLPCKACEIKGMSGVRVKCQASLVSGKKVLFKDKGEILFKENALSGILSFKLSFYMQKAMLQTALVELDFAADKTQQQLYDYILSFKKAKSTEQLLACMFQKTLAQNILERSNSKGEITAKSADMLSKIIKNYTIEVKAPTNISQAQAAFGGFVTDQFDSQTLRLFGEDNIYAMGEMLDVCGDCGGFNLMWAWCSALAVSDDLKKRLK